VKLSVERDRQGSAQKLAIWPHSRYHLAATFGAKQLSS